MNANMLFAEQIIKCVRNDVKNMTVFCNPHDHEKVKLLVNAVNGCLFKNEKDLFLTIIVSDQVTEGEMITSVDGRI